MYWTPHISWLERHARYVIYLFIRVLDGLMVSLEFKQVIEVNLNVKIM